MKGTTQIGYVNRNNQKNLGTTGEKGSDHGQYLYNIECLNCAYQYKANGSDISGRKCPKCQGGRPSSCGHEQEIQSDMTRQSPVKRETSAVIHKTSRNIGEGLRYKVLKRDNFKCCVCGSSPAKDSSVELHVDHVIPWSKGGETIMDNLQTLCSKCNIGKGADL